MFKHEYDFVVGIDFGTMTSGAAFSATIPPELVRRGHKPNVEVIKNWYWSE